MLEVVPSADASAVVARELECSTRFGEDAYSPECEERVNVGMGVWAVVTLLALVILFVWWRRLMRRLRDSEPSDDDAG